MFRRNSAILQPETNKLEMGKADYILSIIEKDIIVVSDRQEIPQCREFVDLLEGMVEDKSLTVLDMQSKMEMEYPGCSGHCINYIFPSDYSGSYVSPVTFPAGLTREEYNYLLSEKKKSLEEEFGRTGDKLRVSDYDMFRSELMRCVTVNTDNYAKGLKASYLEKAKRYVKAFSY